MQPKNQITDNPLKHLGYSSDDILPNRGFGAVLARAGTGKTSFLVQIALNSMLRNKEVIHISLLDPVKKINIWYREFFQLLTNKFGIKPDRQLWETILPFRFILTMKVDGFSVMRLEERLKDLTEQNIFSPRMMIIDGLPFDESTRKALLDLKALIQDMDVHIWFTVKIHRHESPQADGLPLQMAAVKDLFSTIILLQPEGNNIYIQPLKGGEPGLGRKKLEIDPSTLLIREII